ncbi:MAG TPA: methylenetetrahydrofolate reductase [Steroidobacteraceae bacterium]
MSASPESMNATQTLSPAELKKRVVEFTRGASFEISTLDEELLPTLATRIPAGTQVYIAHTPKATLEDIVRVALKVQQLGYRATPHIVARRTPSEQGLKDGLKEMVDSGIDQCLMVAGDLEKPLGRYASSLDILDAGLLEQAGIKRIGVAGHPEGHKSVGPSTLWAALKHKQEFGKRTGIKVHVCTQFGFNPESITAWDAHLREQGIDLPVYVGVAGPTPLPKLIKFAMACGVGASLHSLMKNMSAMSKLARLATTPDEMLMGLVQGGAGSPGNLLVHPHFYAFGGTVATSKWMRAVVDGNFDMPAEGGKFIMDA